MKITQQNLSLIMECSIKTLGDIKDGFRAECKLDLQTYINKKRFDKFYLLPYYAPNKISSPFEVVFNSNNIEILNKYKKSGINYDIIKIDNIFDKLKIPKNYNFIKAENAPIYIKDQGGCGSCWSFAATTALSYRYFKKGITVNLSPQYPLSCSFKNCLGNYGLDPQLDLVKNGTVTEECFPYSSNKGIIEKCPTKCKDGSKLNKYYATNAYKVPKVDESNFYDIVEYIIEQIYNYGPVKSNIIVYDDFSILDNPNAICKNKDYIYSFNGKKNKNDRYSSHAIVIVGFGFLNNEYYWLIQNSYGEEFCEYGFTKIEFGEIGIENIAIIEPYINKNSEKQKDIIINFNSINEECNIDIQTQNNNLNDLENSFEIIFKNTLISSYFYYQCGINISPLTKKQEINCFFEVNKLYYLEAGTYKFEDCKGIHDNSNIFIYDTFKDKYFHFNNIEDSITKVMNMKDIYISSSDSKIILKYNTQHSDKRLMPLIYPNKYTSNYLSDCERLEFLNNNYILCKIKKEEINEFQTHYINLNQNSFFYNSKCGVRWSVLVYPLRLLVNDNPIFYVKKLVLPDDIHLIL